MENAAPDYVCTMPAKKKQRQVPSKGAQQKDSPSAMVQRQAEVQHTVETQAELHQPSEAPEASGAESDASSCITTKKKPRSELLLLFDCLFNVFNCRML